MNRVCGWFLVALMHLPFTPALGQQAANVTLVFDTQNRRLNANAGITAGVRGDDFVVRVTGVAGLPRIRGAEESLEVHEYRDVGKLDGVSALRAQIVQDPLVVGSFVARDGCCTLLMVELISEPEIPQEAIPGMMQEIEAHFTDAGIPPRACTTPV